MRGPRPRTEVRAMDVAPPPELGSRVQEVGDVVLVRFRPRRSWSEIGFLLVWVAFWTIGGLAAIGAIAEADRSTLGCRP